MTADVFAEPSVYAAMAAVMRDIGAVGKSDYNDHQKFNFRGIDSITNAVYGPMCTHGVVVVPEVVDSHYEEVTTSGGKPSRQATLTVRYRFYGPAGDYVDAVTIGEAMDSADKATSKALAAAFKYALLQTFAIPTAGQEDADSSFPERDAPVEYVTEEQVDAIKHLGKLIKDDGGDPGGPWPSVLGTPIIVDGQWAINHAEADALIARLQAVHLEVVRAGDATPSEETATADATVGEADPASPALDEPHGYGLWSRAELEAECKERDIPHSGNMDRLIKELRAWDAVYAADSIEWDERQF